MATGTIILPILAAVGDPSNMPTANFTTAARPYLEFDADTDEMCLWSFRMPQDFAASSLDAKIIWSTSATADTGGVAWVVEIMAMTPETDSVAIDTDSFATGAQGNDTGLGTTAKRPQLLSIDLSSNLDGLVANDYVAVRVSRNADDATNDTIAEDCWLWAFSLEYTTS